jgi:hypothetical protein
VTICSVAPFNDWALANTPFIGNFLPVSLLLLIVVVVLGVNAPLRRVWPRASLSGGELALALGMCLVSCALPTSGFMRYVPGTLVAFHMHAADNPNYARVVRDAQLPDWLFPTFERQDPVDRANEPVIREYVARVQGEPRGLAEKVAVVPWRHWARPAVTWGILAAGLLGMGLLVPVLLHRQWADNERLAFPLATVYLALIEPPEPGRVVGPLFRSPLFWVACMAVFAFHSWNGLAVYFPKTFPVLPNGFDLGRVLTDPPLNSMEWYFKRASIYFSIIGIAFFLQSNASLSLWFFIVVIQLVVMYFASFGIDYTRGMRADASMGAVLTVALTVVFVGRRHLALIVKQMFRGARDDEPRGQFLSYPVAGWLLVASATTVAVWVAAIGWSRPDLTWRGGIESLGVGILVVAGMLTVLVVVYRVVAETGLPFVQLSVNLPRVFLYLDEFLPVRAGLSPTSQFTTAWLSQSLIQDPRESLSPYAGHALRIADESSDHVHRTRHRGIVAALVLALVVAFACSGASMLIVEYNYSETLTSARSPELLNRWLMVDSTKTTLDTMRSMMGYAASAEQHSVLLHFSIGVGITLLLASLRLRFSWWPLLPVGFLLCFTYALQMCWFSILIGWLLKTLTVRFGGARMLKQLRPAFLGLIIGEALAAASWLALSLILYALGAEYRTVVLLPI